MSREKRTRGVFNGSLTIAITPPAATADFAETISAFSDAHPDVQLRVLELRPHLIANDLRDGTLDGTLDVALFAQYTSLNARRNSTLRRSMCSGSRLRSAHAIEAPAKSASASCGRCHGWYWIP
ncbi:MULTISPECIES: LysR substrate-binding domain-containing protein [unclassified Paraburkholderia]|uniref:LysR substrate-binding domain-containing protein n=1 Tax=unclassified Paraburkholderia TaxID=2615204 RepID=UPI003B98351B